MIVTPDTADIQGDECLQVIPPELYEKFFPRALHCSSPVSCVPILLGFLYCSSVAFKNTTNTRIKNNIFFIVL